MDTSWTPQRTELVKEKWAAGLSAGQIAQELGNCTRNAVMGKVHRLDLPPRKTQSRAPRRLRTRGERAADQSAHKRKYVRQVFVHGRHRHIKEVVLQEPIVEIVDSEIPSWQWRHLLELGQHHCRYPVGEVGKPGFFFCGAPKKEGSPYCLPHHQRCHTTNRPDGRFRLATLWHERR